MPTEADLVTMPPSWFSVDGADGGLAQRLLAASQTEQHAGSGPGGAPSPVIAAATPSIMPPPSPQSAQPAAPGGGSDWQRFEPLLAMIPLALKSGGRDAVAALLQGWQRGDEIKRQRAMQDTQLARQRATDDLARRRVDAEDQARKDDAERRRLALIQGSAQRVMGADPALINDTLAAEDAMLQQAGVAGGGRVLRGMVGPYITAKQREARTREVKAALEKAEKIPGAKGGDFVITLPGGQRMTSADARELVGGQVLGSDGQPMAAPPQTFAELFPEARGTSFGQQLVPMKDGAVDVAAATTAARRFGWIGPQPGESPSEHRAAAKDAQGQLRDRLKYALRHPGKASAKTLAREFRAAGLDFNVERDRAAREIEREDLAVTGARRRVSVDPVTGVPSGDEISSADVPTADAIASAFDAAYQRELAGGGGAATAPTPGQTAAVSALNPLNAAPTFAARAPRRKTVTIAQLQKLAAAEGKTLDQVKREAIASGYAVQ